jgi:histidine triad (HIT) family protein
MADDCIFCRIIARQAPAHIVYQDELVTAFHDIHPVAPTHILIVPNRHIASVNQIKADDEGVMGKLFTTARILAAQEEIDQSGYRLIVNTGANAGQAVFHLHLHLIGGQHMRYPMG